MTRCPTTFLHPFALSLALVLSACPDDDADTRPDDAGAAVNTDPEGRGTKTGRADGGTDAAVDGGALDAASSVDADAPEAALPDASTTDAGVDAGEPGDTLPQDGLVLWLRADRGVTHDEMGVSAWRDQSPNHNDAVQSDATKRPGFGKLEPGAPDILMFDGVNDQLTLPSGFADFSEGLTLILIALNHAQNTHAAYFELSNGTEVDDISLGRVEGKFLFEVFSDARVSDPTIPTDTPMQLAAVLQPSGSFELHRDGYTIGSGTMQLPATRSREFNFVGRSMYANSAPLEGALAEIILYRRALEATELAAITKALTARWDCCAP